MKESKTGDPGRHLKAGIKYIIVPEKTENGRWVSAVNCQVSSAYEQMIETKKRFCKTGERQGYHIVLSFKQGEVSVDTVFQLTKKFVKEYLGENYEAVFAVHTNTDHPHSHIIFNSVSFVDGKKYHYKKGDWEREIQPITNRLCQEYGLSTLELDQNSGNIKRDAYKEWNLYRDGVFVWRDMVARDIDGCILQAGNYAEFLNLLKEKGYEIKNGNGEGKYLAVKPKGMKRFVRVKSIGENYTEEEIQNRINTDFISDYSQIREAKIVFCRVKKYKRAALGKMQKKYYHKLYRLGKIKKKAYSEVWKYKDDIKKMQNLQRQYLFLVEHNLQTMSEVEKIESLLLEEKKQITEQKNYVYRTNRKNSKLYHLKEQMDSLLACEHTYQKGNQYFTEEHEKWVRLEKELQKLGYSYDEVKDLKRYYEMETIKWKERDKEVRRNLSIIEQIKNKFIDTVTNYDEKEISERHYDLDKVR